MGSEKKLKITNKQIAVGIIVLVIVAVLAAIWLRTSDNSEMEDGYHLTVSRGGEILRT